MVKMNKPGETFESLIGQRRVPNPHCFEVGETG